MSAPTLPAESRRILELARHDRAAARKAMAALSLDAQVALVCEAPVSRRGELLDLAPQPESLVPALPEAELCYTVKALGLHDAPWVLAHATPEQLVACVDLDAWREFEPDPQGVGRWIAALCEAGEDSALRVAHALDPELLVLWLRDCVEVVARPPTSEDDGWEPPGGAFTLEGQFYLVARDEKDDLQEVRALLDALFRHDYWRYFRLVQGAIHEPTGETEEWALRWRAGRLLDLGFPPWEEAMAIYGVVPERQRAQLAEAPLDVPIGEWPLPIWMPRLPVASDASESLFRALAGLRDDERRPWLYAFLALANRVAVADRLPLGDAETIPAALARAARLASRGLDFLVRAHDLGPTDVLRRTTLERLFRVGFSLAPDRGAGGGGEEPE